MQSAHTNPRKMGIVLTFVLVRPGSVPGVAQLGDTLVHDFSVQQLLVLQVLRRRVRCLAQDESCFVTVLPCIWNVSHRTMSYRIDGDLTR